jgi:hypothetical protein
MANSKLLKEAIADAKAVRETAITNAKIALEEAFTPRLQSILSRKLQSEMEDMEDSVELEEEYGAEDVSGDDSSDIGAGEGNTGSGTDNAQPTGGAKQDATVAHTELDPETEEETASVGKEDENMPLAEENEMDFSDMEEEEEMMDDEELDLESIIRELESDLDEEEDENQDGVIDDPTGAYYNEEEDMEMSTNDEMHEEEGEDDVIDLEEILREMGYGEEEEVTEEEEGEMDAEKMAEMEAELEEAYKVIKSLRGTINEVNLLNAKLLYANKLFRSYNLNNEQKVKVVENLDRTNSVREVKLVYATLAESMKFGGADRKQTAKRVVSEGMASKATASTAPKKEIIAESNELANRFKKLAGII